METSVVTFGLLRDWMDAQGIAGALPFNEHIVQVTQHFPAVFRNPLVDSGRLTLGGSDMVQLIAMAAEWKDDVARVAQHVDQFQFPVIVVMLEGMLGAAVGTMENMLDALVDVQNDAHPLIAVAGRPGRARSIVERMEWRDARIRNMEEKDVAERARVRGSLDLIMARVIGGLDTGDIGDATRAWDEEMQLVDEMGRDVFEMVAQVKNVAHSKDEEKMDEQEGKSGVAKKAKLAEPRRYVVSEELLPLDAVDLAAGNVTQAGAGPTGPPNGPGRPAPLAGVIPGAGLTIRDESTLTAMPDAFTTFLKVACGLGGMPLYKMYVVVPQPFPRKPKQRDMEAYLTCLAPVALAVVMRTQDFIIRATSVDGLHQMMMNDVFALPTSNLVYMAAAKLCGVYLRDARASDVSRGPLTRFTEPNRQVPINEAEMGLIRKIRGAQNSNKRTRFF